MCEGHYYNPATHGVGTDKHNAARSERIAEVPVTSPRKYQIKLAMV